MSVNKDSAKKPSGPRTSDSRKYFSDVPDRNLSLSPDRLNLPFGGNLTEDSPPMELGCDNWLDRSSTLSPSEDIEFFANAGPSYGKQPSTNVRPKPRKPTPISVKNANLMTVPENDDKPPSSPSQTHWEALRKRVLVNPSASNSSFGLLSPTVQNFTPSSTPTHSKQPSTSSSILSVPSARAPTPKQSRLARLGFRQVVEHAREVTINDSKRFADDVKRSCWAAKYPVLQGAKGAKGDHFGYPDAAGSSAFLPFISSNTSLPISMSSALHNNASSTVLNLSQGSHQKKQDTRSNLKQLPSIQSLAQSSRLPLTVKYLYQTLTSQEATALRNPDASLPHESHVLTTLLGPFSGEDGQNQENASIYVEVGGTGSPRGEKLRTDEEQWLALESFEVLCKTWPASPEGNIERSLWCCKAAYSSPSLLRARIVGNLWNLLRPSTQPSTQAQLSPKTPSQLLTLSQALFALMSILAQTGDSKYNRNELHLVRELVLSLQGLSPNTPKALGTKSDANGLDTTAFEEVYGIGNFFSKKDDEDVIKNLLVFEGLVRCMENLEIEEGEWLLRNILEEFWPNSPHQQTTLTLAMKERALRMLNRALLSITSACFILPNGQLEHNTGDTTIDIIIRVLKTLVLPDLFSELQGKSVARSSVTVENRVQAFVRIVLEILCRARSGSSGSIWAAASLGHWFQGGCAEWKRGFEVTVQQLFKDGDWFTLSRVFDPLFRDSGSGVVEAAKRSIAMMVIPLLHEYIASNPPPFPSLQIASTLTLLSQLYPQLFFKPIFLCVTASSLKENLSVLSSNFLVVLTLSKYVQTFWTGDADMVSLALVSLAPGGVITAKGTGVETDDTNDALSEASPDSWVTAALGQTAMLVELILKIKSMRIAREGTQPQPARSSLNQSVDDDFVPDDDLLDTAKFIVGLETRLSVLIHKKEQKTRVAPSQRILFCVLFTEMRLFTRSLKPAPWLSYVATWLAQYLFENASLVDSEVASTQVQLLNLYSTAQETTSKLALKRTSNLLSPVERTFPLPTEKASDSDLVDMLKRRTRFVTEGVERFTAKALELLVTLSGLLSSDDYRRLGPLLWDRCLEDPDPKVIAPACFLLMQSAEKIQADFMPLIEADLSSTSSAMRQRALTRISTLCAWRFQIVSQQAIVDRAHRRPFKLARGPLPFVATDIGSPQFVLDEQPDEIKDNLPLELRKRLVEIGWADESTQIDEKLGWLRTPMSLLPGLQLDRLQTTDDFLNSPGSTPNSSPQKGVSADGGLLRRKSSTTAGPLSGVKRKAIFVPSLAAIFPQLAALVFDSNITVASSAKAVLMDLMRNDPVMILRPALDFLVESSKDVSTATSTIQAFLHLRHQLPPTMAHQMFNCITGFLKHDSRHGESLESLQDYARMMPFLSKLVGQVNEMSIREIRRAKVETLLIPSGSLWFTTSSPMAAMFPRCLSPQKISDAIPPDLGAITMIRLSQNMLFLSMLKRSPQDVQIIRKNLSRFVLPTVYPELSAKLELKDFLPRKARRRVNSGDKGVDVLSLMLARSHILLVAQIFRSMSRHLNDRNELAVLVDGINRILLRHGDDIGIVAQAMIAFMVASTRFRRLFTSGGAYALFMPAVIKVYAESECHSGIRQAIEYAISRFYATHAEHFVFQTLDIMGHIITLPDADSDWVAETLYIVAMSLKKDASLSISDAAGIHRSNKSQEREALMVSTAEEKPQAFLASLRRGGTQGNGLVVSLPEEYEAKKLGVENFIRLFLTVIAHDPTILRAQHFLKFFRFVTPLLYEESNSTRILLHDGIDALGVVITKTIFKARVVDAVPLPRLDDVDPNGIPDALLENQLLDQSKSPNDANIMRQEYLSLVLAFKRAGGQLAPVTSQRVIELVKLMLRDSSGVKSNQISTFLTNYTMSLSRQESPLAVKHVVGVFEELTPLVGAYAIDVDLSGVFTAIADLTAKPAYANDHSFVQLVVRLCGAGLGVCEMAASENLLQALPLRSVLVVLVSRVVFLRDSNVVLEIEKRRPTHQFLAEFVLPLVMKLRTSAETMSSGIRAEVWHQEARKTTWMRLLWYAISSCSWSKKESRELLTVPKAMQHRSSNRGETATLVTALQIIKAIIVRAEADLSSSLPDVWPRIGAFLKSFLSAGNAKFVSTSTLNFSSPPTPSHPSCPSSLLGGHVFPVATSASPQTPVVQETYQNPRIIDYCMWSLFEFLCLCRTPLIIQLRLFMQEQLSFLHQDLLYRQELGGLTPKRSRPASTSLFSKPRRRVSGAPSPTNLPRLVVSTVTPQNDSSQQFYQRFPASPGTSESGPGPKIIHLGPVSNSSHTMFRRPASPGVGPEGGGRLLAKASTIKSVSLVKSTYRRIRLVQRCMGFDSLLLPLPSGVQESDADQELASWTKRQALDALMKETAELHEEFEMTHEEKELEMNADSRLD